MATPDDGRKKVSDGELLRVAAEVLARDGCICTREVVERTDLTTREGARERMDQLVERGIMESKDAGSRVYWFSDCPDDSASRAT